jgi:hypothetical protein
MSAIEELLGRKGIGSGLENRKYWRRDPSRWTHGTRYPQKVALSSPTNGGRSVGIVRLRTHATEFFQELPLGRTSSAHVEVYWLFKLNLVCCVTDICQKLGHISIPSWKYDKN